MASHGSRTADGRTNWEGDDVSDNEENKTGAGQKPAWVENFIKRLQAQGFVQWDPVTWIKPEDIPVWVAKGKINRSRRRRALLMGQRAEAKTQKGS